MSNDFAKQVQVMIFKNLLTRNIPFPYNVPLLKLEYSTHDGPITVGLVTFAQISHSDGA